LHLALLLPSLWNSSECLLPTSVSGSLCTRAISCFRRTWPCREHGEDTGGLSRKVWLLNVLYKRRYRYPRHSASSSSVNHWKQFPDQSMDSKTSVSWSLYIWEALNALQLDYGSHYSSFGRYLSLAGHHFAKCPPTPEASGSAATKSPLSNEPRTLKKYQTSRSSTPWQPITAVTLRAAVRAWLISSRS
jgi:hypothetical protein